LEAKSQAQAVDFARGEAGWQNVPYIKLSKQTSRKFRFTILARAHFKGALAKQFVLQELRTFDESNVYYWSTENNTAEIEFLLQCDSKIIPVEVKSGLRTQAKSLSSYIARYKPELAIKASLRNFGVANDIRSIPLYLVGRWRELIAD
jgi:predicted AAA+ superfamily ATPase